MADQPEVEARSYIQCCQEVADRQGINEDRISTKWISDATDISASILEEAGTGDYQTLVIGRCGHCDIKNRMGSVTEKLIRQGAGTALCIVE